MKYKIEYEERIINRNSIIVEVENEEEGETLADELYGIAHKWDHPDCLREAIYERGYEIVETCECCDGAEYEIL